MEFKEILDEKIWTNFLAKNPVETFLQSWQWGEFNQKNNTPIFRFGLYEKNELMSICLVLKIIAKRATFLLVPHGPVIAQNLDPAKYLKLWSEYLKTFGLEQKVSFIRIQPIVLKNLENQQIFKALSYKPAPIHMHTELTTVLDLTQSLDSLLMNMRKTTRQMVKKAFKMVENGELQVTFPKKINEEMLQVYKDTYLRGGAVAFSQKFIENEWKVFSQNDGAKLISILHEGKVVSWGMFLFVNNRAFYHQGGNILSKNLPNSYLLQWLGINEAKKQGCIRYDFWGVAPVDKPEHPWANISLFKRGFGGSDVELLHAQDLVISPLKYFPNWLLETFRAKRGDFSNLK